MAYEHCQDSNHEVKIARFRFVWDFRWVKSHQYPKFTYPEWCQYCADLKKFFERYPEVKWRCNSFQFIVQCDNLLWVAEQILHVQPLKVLSDVTTVQQFVDGRGHVELTLLELQRVT